MVESELAQHVADKRVLWLVQSHGAFTSIDAIKLRYSNEWGYIVWGYSVYRRSPGFRTIGSSLQSLTRECKLVELFVDQQDAIDCYLANNPKNTLSVDEIKRQITPCLRFLKRENYSHNLTVDV